MDFLVSMWSNTDQSDLHVDLCCAVMLVLIMLEVQDNLDMKGWSDAYYFLLFAQVGSIS